MVGSVDGQVSDIPAQRWDAHARRYLNLLGLWQQPHPSSMPAFWVFRCQYHKPVAGEEPAELLGSEEVAPLTKSSVNQPGGRGTKIKRINVSVPG